MQLDQIYILHTFETFKCQYVLRKFLLHAVTKCYTEWCTFSPFTGKENCFLPPHRQSHRWRRCPLQSAPLLSATRKLVTFWQPKNSQIIVEEKTTCRLHRKSPNLQWKLMLNGKKPPGYWPDSPRNNVSWVSVYDGDMSPFLLKFS